MSEFKRAKALETRLNKVGNWEGRGVLWPVAHIQWLSGWLSGEGGSQADTWRKRSLCREGLRGRQSENLPEGRVCVCVGGRIPGGPGQ